MSNEITWKETSTSRRENVLSLLSDGSWHGTAEICSVNVGGSEGCRRLRELRKHGWTVEKRRKTDSTQFEYRLGR
jgi:hypothetical protein